MHGFLSNPSAALKIKMASTLFHAQALVSQLTKIATMSPSTCRVALKSSQTFDDHALEEVTLNEDGYLEFAPDDTENPKSWSVGRKCYLSGVAILVVMNATFASSAPTGAVQGISKDLHVSVEATGMVTTLFLLGYVAGPLVWAPLSEFYG